MESLNRMATELVDEALEFADELAVDAYDLENGATVIDFGVDAIGGVEAGLLLAEIQAAGLATVASQTGSVAGTPRTYVEFSTDHPALALLCSQKAGWDAFPGDYEGLGSGPARALAAREEEFNTLAYRDEFDFGVLCVESDELPGPEVAEEVADLCEIEPSGVFLPTFRTGSIAGSVSMAARAAELVAFRAFELGYDPLDVLTVTARAPVAPPTDDEEVAIARTNDALAYGGQAHVVVESDSDVLTELPSSATDRYGEPFADIFEDVDWDLHEVDEGVFAPAQVTVDVLGGPTYALGDTDEDLLAESFGLA